MASPEQTIIVNVNAETDQIVIPRIGRYYSPPALVLPRDRVAIVLQVLKGEAAVPDANGAIPDGYGLDLSDYGSGILFGLKTQAQIDAGATVFTDSGATRLTDHALYDLENGRDVVEFLASSATTAQTLFGQFYLQRSNGDVRRFLRSPARFTIPSRVVLGSESGAIPDEWIGTTSITAGNSYVDVSITNMTAATGAAIVTQKAPTGNISGCIPTVSYSSGSFRITSNSTCPTGYAWNFYYEVRHL